MLLCYNPPMLNRVVLASALVLAALCVAGCEEALFSKEEPRSPFDRYMLLRGRQRPATSTNVWGGEEPALRERLKPLNSP